MNKKLLIIPTIVLSSTLLLTGCTLGKTEPGKADPTGSSSSAPNTGPSSGDTQPTGSAGYVAPPAELDEKYKGYFMAPMSVTEEAWSYYKSIGAKTYKEDPSVRSTTLEDWDSARNDDKNYEKFDKLYGEVLSDVEQSALNISSYLEKNPSSTLDDIKNNKDLVINRYTNLGTTTVEKDSNKGFYFVIFNINGGKSAGYGILVPQNGITPDFDAPPTQ